MISVEVSGSRFCIVPSLFQHIKDLHWKKKNRKSKSPSTSNKHKQKNGKEENDVVVFQLKHHANPDIFEYVLQFFLSGNLPDKNKLSYRKAEKLIEFVQPNITTPPSSSSSSSRQSNTLTTTPSTYNNVTTSNTNTTSNNNNKTSIPSQIDTFTTKIIDDGSISKLSFQSSSSDLPFIQDENDNINVPTTATTTKTGTKTNINTFQKISLREKSNAALIKLSQYNDTTYTVPITTYNYGIDIPEKSSSLTTENLFNGQQQQTTIPTINDSFTPIINNVDDSNKRNIVLTNNNSNSKRRSTKKILRSILGGVINNNNEPRLQMTHAEWCSTEYVV
ncbi:hypothetical protein FRACYDRAFT_234708 [Fragilariopsis cylindrus CCMP1102]|uniref:BTB domain-containing protein n=1 Tax=Fragilariopsis cylindrus CCMP1102 TaxID=635003 RepID=A0A1E7FSC5_9STRA|nr:hypothetical protein FRACYDRAFT_234708 [Fragilariopsis cylindrus CCMP1102]|eukprot:OEU21082.1 hypothetical protein FRACYDRAFT_234708 [Fragilariopsis cylindrus CCMP1102]